MERAAERLVTGLDTPLLNLFPEFQYKAYFDSHFNFPDEGTIVLKFKWLVHMNFSPKSLEDIYEKKKTRKQFSSKTRKGRNTFQEY